MIAGCIISLVIALFSAPFDAEFSGNALDFSVGSAVSTLVDLVSMAGLALALVLSAILDIIALATRTAATIVGAFDECCTSEPSYDSW